MSHTNAITVNANGIARTLISEVGVSLPFSGNPTEQKNLEIKTYKGIWDTGATGSVITKKVAEEIGLSITGQKEVHTATKSEIKNTYLVNIYIPEKIIFQGIEVTEGVLYGDIEMLIGMDIITSGDFTITHNQGKTKMSFGVPSVHSYDYAEIINERNKILTSKMKCNCGSGKKYIYCHGKNKNNANS